MAMPMSVLTRDGNHSEHQPLHYGSFGTYLPMKG